MTERVQHPRLLDNITMGEGAALEKQEARSTCQHNGARLAEEEDSNPPVPPCPHDLIIGNNAAKSLQPGRADDLQISSRSRGRGGAAGGGEGRWSGVGGRRDMLAGYAGWIWRVLLTTATTTDYRIEYGVRIFQE